MITKFLARDLVCEVKDGVTFLHVGGLESLSHLPSTERADTTDFDSNGRGEHIPSQRGDQWTLAGFALEDVGTGDKDPGQLRIEDLAKLTGLSSMGTFRLTSPGGNTETFDGSAELTKPSGGHNDAAKWGVTIEVSGQPIYGFSS